MLFGWLIGAMTPLFAFAVLWEIYPELPAIEKLDERLWAYLLTRVAIFGVIINAGIFALALRTNHESLAKGVLFPSVIYALVAAYFKFMY